MPAVSTAFAGALEATDAGALPAVDAGLGAIAVYEIVTGWYVWWWRQKEDVGPMEGGGII